MTRYAIQPHVSQYQGGASAITRSSGCTWSSGANGVNAVTKRTVTPDQVHAQVKRSEEENPNSPGWTIGDLDLAMSRLGVPFADRRGAGWGAVIAYSDAGYYLTLQGDSDQFGDSTCSGAFDGNHCIGMGPNVRIVNGRRQRLIDDPICKEARWEYETVLQRYASKLNSRILFGQFTTRVPHVDGLELYPGASRTTPYPDRTRTDEPDVNVHTAPLSDSKVRRVIRKKGTLFVAYQETYGGSKYAGSRRWLGNKAGTEWVHAARLSHEDGGT